MNRYEKELMKLVKIVGEGNDIATLSAKSFEMDEFEEFEAHEIHDIAKSSEHFFYDEKSQTVHLA